jgi:hypothetical protein
VPLEKDQSVRFLNASLTSILNLGEKLKRRLDQLEKLEAENRHDGLPVNTNIPLAPVSEQVTDQQVQFATLNNSPASIDDALIYSGTRAEDIINSSNCLPELSSDLTIWDTNLFNDSALFNECLIPFESITRVDCGCKNPHLEIIRSAGSKQYRYFPQNHHHDQHPSPPTSNPTPETFQISRLCTIRALLANCEHLGVTEPMICVTDETYPSIFLRSASLNRTGVDCTTTAATIKRTQAIFSSLEPDLRPIPEQIATSHWPVIDILPFPTFRRNLILHRPDLNKEELVDDLVDGLICWVGGGRKGRSGASEMGAEGTPWDCKSWEAKEWFWKKYWTMLGGEEGELVKQSVWWRRIRGEGDVALESVVC